jgi:hypothetical protein
MPRKPLRVVVDGEEPGRLNVSDAAASGDHRDLLVAMRERIARAVSDPTCPPRDLASLTRRLQDIAREIEALDRRAEQEGREGVSSPDEAFDSSAI